jgi:agmatine deiminase
VAALDDCLFFDSRKPETEMIDKRTLFKSTLGAISAMSALTASKLDAAEPTQGFWLPEEAEKHRRTFMQWPANRKVYRDPVFLAMVQQKIALIANSIVQFEPLVMLMDKKHEKKARKLLSSAIEIWHIATDDLWCRDSGPTFVRNGNGELAISQLNFNGWGNKQVYGNDGKIAARVAEQLGVPLINMVWSAKPVALKAMATAR